MRPVAPAKLLTRQDNGPAARRDRDLRHLAQLGSTRRFGGVPRRGYDVPRRRS